MPPRPKLPQPRLLGAPGAKSLLVSAWLWQLSRWCGMFSCGYLVAARTDMPLLNQLVGVTLFAPMILGGMLVGAISDRVDRRRLVIGTQLVLIPVSLLVFALVRQDAMQVWMAYPFVFALGVGGLMNMTALRPLLYETVGAELATRALTLETVVSASANAAGALAGGLLIGALGMSAAFAFIALTLCLSVLLLARVPRPPASVAASDAVPFRSLIKVSALALRASPSLASMLGVTVVFNLCFSSFVPLVPVMAKRLGASALMTGVLGAAVSAGSLVAGLALTSFHVSRRGHVYVGGTALALVGLTLFAAARVMSLALGALLVAGMGQAGFSAMQSVLAMDSMGDAGRGASLGLLSTAIGVMPIGMLIVGVGTQWQGPRATLLASSLLGLVVLVLWLRHRPEVLEPAARHSPRAAKW